MYIEKSKNKPLPKVGDIVESVDSGNYYLITKSITDEEYLYINLEDSMFTNGTYPTIKQLMIYLLGDSEYIIHKSTDIKLIIGS